MSKGNKDFLSEGFDAEEIDDQSDIVETIKTTINIDARRKVEDYQEQRELNRLINDEWDYFDDIA